MPTVFLIIIKKIESFFCYSTFKFYSVFLLLFLPYAFFLFTHLLHWILLCLILNVQNFLIVLKCFIITVDDVKTLKK